MKLIAARLLALMLWLLFLVPHVLAPALALWRILFGSTQRAKDGLRSMDMTTNCLWFAGSPYESLSSHSWREFGLTRVWWSRAVMWFTRQFKWALTSRQIYKWLQLTPEETLTDIQRAARFFYLQKNAFGGKVENQNFGTATTSGPRLNLLRLEEDLSQAHLRLSQTYIEHLGWEACIAKYDRDHTLFYCDPPYYGTEGYGVAFGLDQYARMAELARTIKGKMIISVNDIPEMRKAFAGLHMESVDITYTVGGGKKGSKTAELVIRNWR